MPTTVAIMIPVILVGYRVQDQRGNEGRERDVDQVVTQ